MNRLKISLRVQHDCYKTSDRMLPDQVLCARLLRTEKSSTFQDGILSFSTLHTNLNGLTETPKKAQGPGSARDPKVKQKRTAKPHQKSDGAKFTIVS